MTARPQHDEPAGVRLFVVLPAEACTARAPECLKAFCAHADVASLLLPGQAEVPEELLRELTEQAQALGVAVLVHDDVARCRRLKADGVHVTARDARRIAALRRELGPDMIIGACCPAQRHLAMELGEAGADYLGIDQRVQARGENLLAWWAQMFTVPVVAMQPAAPRQVADVARLGADFLVPVPEMWQDAAQADMLARAYDENLRQIAPGTVNSGKSG